MAKKERKISVKVKNWGRKNKKKYAKFYPPYNGIAEGKDILYYNAAPSYHEPIMLRIYTMKIPDDLLPNPPTATGQLDTMHK